MVETGGAEFHKTTAGSHKSDPSSSPSEYSLQQQNQKEHLMIIPMQEFGNTFEE